MSPNLQEEEDLVDRDTALYVAQSQPPPSTCSVWTAAPVVTRSWAAHRAARKVCHLKFAGENFCEVRAATKALASEPSLFASNLRCLPQTFAVCLKPSLFASNLRCLRYTMRLETKEGMPTRVSRLEQTLNKPKVVLVVGVLAVALNVLLYFGLFLPRMTPLIAHINPIGTSLPEAISKSDPVDGSKSDSESSSNSGPEVSSKSDSESSSNSGSEGSLASETDPPPADSPPTDSPSGSPPADSPPADSPPTDSPSGSP